MEKNKMSIDLILNTIPAAHQVMDYMNLLNFNGTIV
jgi:alcohol dehydrogenase (NADP+)